MGGQQQEQAQLGGGQCRCSGDALTAVLGELDPDRLGERQADAGQLEPGLDGEVARRPAKAGLIHAKRCMTGTRPTDKAEATTVFSPIGGMALAPPRGRMAPWAASGGATARRVPSRRKEWP